MISCRNSFLVKAKLTTFSKLTQWWYLCLQKCCVYTQCCSCVWQYLVLNYVWDIHFLLAVWNPRKMNELSRVHAPTAPNCRKGAVACPEADMHIRNTWCTQTTKIHVKKQQTFTLLVSFPHLQPLTWDPYCTRSERGTVGHSFFQQTLIPVTPKAMNITPKNKKICVGKQQIWQ